MSMQYYGTTGRRYTPDYVGVIEATKRYLPKRKQIADEEAYRNRLYGLETERLAQTERLTQDQIEAQRKASDTSAMIGLGQLGYNTRAGKVRDTKLKEALSGGGGATGGIKPEAGTTGTGSVKPDIGAGSVGPAATTASKGALQGLSPSGGFWSGLKKGASNWGDIAMGSLVGGTVGAGLGEKYVPFGGKKEKRIVGGAATSGLLSYLSSGDPYTAGLSALFGGAIGGFA